jgi:hypothetical protein
MSLRTELASARIHLRRCEDDFKRTKAHAEIRIIDRAGGSKALGANAEERERVLITTLYEDVTYLEALEELRKAQATVDIMQAQVEDIIDERKRLDRESRDRLAAALHELALNGRTGFASETEETST